LTRDRQRTKATEAELASLFAAHDAAERDIDTAFDDYVCVLNNRRKQMKDDLRKLYLYKRDTMLQYIEEIRKQAASLNGMIEQCTEAMEIGNISDLLAYKLKITSKNQETMQLSPNYQAGLNYIKFDRDDPEGHIASLLDDIGSLHSQATLPVKVKVIEQTAVACLFTSMSIYVKNSASEDLDDYPITVDIKDIYDDDIPTLVQYRSSGHYEVSFKPSISGVHRVRVKFLHHVIVGGEFNITVQSNNTIGKIGVEGSGPGEMMYPRAVAIDRFNNLYVVDTGNNRIQKFDSAGGYLNDFPISHESENYSSCGAAINNEQAVLICPEVRMHEADMAMADTILVYSLEGQLLHRLANRDHLRKALSVAVNSAGHIIIADFEYNTIFIFDRPGRLLHKFGESGSGPGQFNHPTFLCVGHDDCIIVSDGDNHRIQVFDKLGKFEYQFGGKGTEKGQFNMPFGVTTDAHGNILVVDGGNKRIQIFKYGGEFSGCIESLANKMNAPRGIAVTTDGQVLVADRDNHCVKKYRYMNCTAV
jgi:DNA-binding beta-propeller fold protein YncE